MSPRGSLNRGGLTDAIRALLADAGMPLTRRQIVEALPLSVNAEAVSALLGQRQWAGEFEVQIVDGISAYSLASSFATPQRKKKAPPVRKPVPSPEQAPTVCTAAVDAMSAHSTAPPFTAPPAAEKAQSVGAFGLLDRLDAIATDIEDAIGDSIDQALPPQIVKALVTAGAGLRRAAHLIHRS